MKLFKNRLNNETDVIEQELLKHKGFVTIATGKEQYHKMAYKLLESYKLTSDHPYRFAVITDRESSYTEYFDDVIIIDDATRTYMDKISLLVNCPYSENIFIDADCLAFGDLNVYWNCFRDASDFSCFGRVLPLESGEGWFQVERLGKFKNNVKNNLDIHGGIYFIKKGKLCKELYDTSVEIIDNYEKFGFRRFKRPADEPILALAMAVHQCLPAKAEPQYFAWFRRTKRIHADFFEKKLEYYFDNKFTDQGILIHFGTSRTICPLYLVEAEKVQYMAENGKRWNKMEQAECYLKCYMKSVLYGTIYLYKRLRKIWSI